MVGCIDIEQKLILNEDFSGSLELCYVIDETVEEIANELTIDSALIKKEEIEALTDTCLAKVEHVNETRNNDQRFIEIKYTFKDINDLSDSWCSDSNRIYLKQEGGFIILRWTFTGNGSNSKDSLFFEKRKNLFEGHYCEFYIDLPSEIVEVSSGGEILEDRTKAYWKFPTIEYMMGKTLELKAKFKNLQRD